MFEKLILSIVHILAFQSICFLLYKSSVVGITLYRRFAPMNQLKTARRVKTPKAAIAQFMFDDEGFGEEGKKKTTEIKEAKATPTML